MGSASNATDGQRYSTTVRQSQFAMLGEARRPAAVDAQIIAHCESLLDSIRLCIHMSNFSHQHICDTLGIDKGHWARMMQGRAHFPTNRIVPLMELCGNYAPLQYLAASCGFALKDGRQEKIEQLERELEAARRAA